MHTRLRRTLAKLCAARRPPRASCKRHSPVSPAAARNVASRADSLTTGGNVRSMWHREGGYDAIAEKLFNSLHHDRLLLEYDTERAGGLEPLRLLPKGTKRVMPGFITTKTGERLWQNILAKFRRTSLTNSGQASSAQTNNNAPKIPHFQHVGGLCAAVDLFDVPYLPRRTRTSIGFGLSAIGIGYWIGIGYRLE